MHAGKRPLDPGGDKDMVCGLDVCDELDELDESSFSDTYVNDRQGDYTDEEQTHYLSMERHQQR